MKVLQKQVMGPRKFTDNCGSSSFWPFGGEWGRPFPTFLISEMTWRVKVRWRLNRAWRLYAPWLS